jgi:hypothetical protein
MGLFIVLVAVALFTPDQAMEFGGQDTTTPTELLKELMNGLLTMATLTWFGRQIPAFQES